MSNILLKRGTSANFNSIVLKTGELAFITDLNKLYIGSGSQKIIINPIDKPLTINMSNFYSKVKVNEYGQVISQGNLVASDIPNISYTQVTGLGSSAITNTGINPGNVPVLNPNGKLADSVIPTVPQSYIYAYFSGATGTIVSANQIVPLSNHFAAGSAFSFDSGTININEPGIYIVSYNITSSSLQLSTALSYATASYWSGTASKCSTTAVPSYVTTCATVVRQVTATPEKYAIRNTGATDIVLINGYGSISIAKL